MPVDDLLRFIGGPLTVSAWWLWIGVLLVVLVIGWCVGVFVWTLPPARLRRMPVLRNVHSALTRRRFTRTIARTNQQYLAGGLSAPQAGAAVGRALRSFLFVTTGVRAQYLHVGDLAVGELAKVRPLLSALNDVQFNRVTRTDMVGLGRSAEELIRSWR